MIACLSIAGGEQWRGRWRKKYADFVSRHSADKCNTVSNFSKAGQLPRDNRLEPWQYDRAFYRKRNEIERPFLRLVGVRRTFSRFDKLEVVFLVFISFALIVEGLRWC